jgi:hypothetical protein
MMPKCTTPFQPSAKARFTVCAPAIFPPAGYIKQWVLGESRAIVFKVKRDGFLAGSYGYMLWADVLTQRLQVNASPCSG